MKKQENVICDAVTYAEHARRTVTAVDVSMLSRTLCRIWGYVRNLSKFCWRSKLAELLQLSLSSTESYPCKSGLLLRGFHKRPVGERGGRNKQLPSGKRRKQQTSAELSRFS
ncbi:hypothetical protein C5167_030950 [Papaver somniferum]|nr:hypothetical protein C5167_030950 [Papaver somniferum]